MSLKKTTYLLLAIAIISSAFLVTPTKNAGAMTADTWGPCGTKVAAGINTDFRIWTIATVSNNLCSVQATVRYHVAGIVPWQYDTGLNGYSSGVTSRQRVTNPIIFEYRICKLGVGCATYQK